MSNPFDLGGMGGLGGLGAMMGNFKQQMQQMQQEKENKHFSVEADNGLLTVCVNGNKDIVDIEIDDELMSDRERLEDLLIESLNQAMGKVDDFNQQQVSQLTAGLPIPPGMLGL